MNYMNDYNNNDFNIEEDEVIYINGNEEELVPGLNDFMRTIFELYMEEYMEPGYLDLLDENEPITIDLTKLSDREMKALINCAVICMELEDQDPAQEAFLS